MKNLNLIINAMLVIAVGVLFYLHFNSRSPEALAAGNTVYPEVKSSAIVYVNSDSLLDNYNFLKTKKAELEARHKKITADLDAEGTSLQSDAQSYQQRAAMMTDEQRQKTEEQLVQRQQQLVQKEKTMMAKLDDEQEKINDELFRKLTAYLKEYNNAKNYQFILGYQKGGGILLANDSLDITQAILDGLNKKYSEESGAN